MASDIKKYISVNDDNVVQGEMKFPSGDLKIKAGEEYKDINQVFIKGVQIQGVEGSEPIVGEVDTNGVATITIDALDVDELTANQLEADNLSVDGKSVNKVFQNLGSLNRLETIDSPINVDGLVERYNGLVNALKGIMSGTEA